MKPDGKKIFDRAIKKQSLPRLEKELDRIFSLYIRQRDADQNGNVKCCTCPAISHWKEMDCGHFWSRRHRATRWHDQNCGPQCTACNIFQEGNKPAFMLYLQRRYGGQILELLELKKNNIAKYGRFELGIMIEEYKQKLAAL